MNNRFFYSIFFVLSTVFVLQTQPFAEPTNLGLLKKQLVQYHDSGQYLEEIKQVANQASRYIEEAAQTNTHLSQPKKLALVLDIDETCLSNFSNMKLIDFANMPDKISEQLLAADEPAIQPVHDLYLKALQKNISVFFVTGRDPSLAAATAQNLQAAGYLSWSGLEFRPVDIPSITFKTATRAKITQQGYTIIASIGDQDSDLIGGYAARTFKLPNPFYYIP